MKRGSSRVAASVTRLCPENNRYTLHSPQDTKRGETCKPLKLTHITPSKPVTPQVENFPGKSSVHSPTLVGLLRYQYPLELCTTEGLAHDLNWNGTCKKDAPALPQILNLAHPHPPLAALRTSVTSIAMVQKIAFPYPTTLLALRGVGRRGGGSPGGGMYRWNIHPSIHPYIHIRKGPCDWIVPCIRRDPRRST